MASVEEQDRLLEEAQSVVKAQAFQMKRCLDKNKLMDALKHASTMLSELRTSLLSPKYYYQLYMSICDELRHLEVHLLDEFQKGHRVPDLYELVQYAGNIIPRLYLLITVGVVYIKSNEMSRRDILKDLVEMCRGVQHPLRGLFLRNYLLQCTRNVLPDQPLASEAVIISDGATTALSNDHAEQASGSTDLGNVLDSVDFILLNFGEMNKLWVRMQYLGHSREFTRREQERRELRILVGTNLVRLSQLESLDIVKYRTLVLPALLEQVVSCRDPISQEYLLDCIIHVFTDDFHLQTLKTLLSACVDLHPNVNFKNIFINLIDRLSQYLSSPNNTSGIPPDLFDIFSDYIGQAIEARSSQSRTTGESEGARKTSSQTEPGAAPSISLEDIVALQAALTQLAIKCYPKQIEYVQRVLAHTGEYASQYSKRIAHNSPLCRELTRLMKLPVEYFSSSSSLGTLLELAKPLCSLMQRLDLAARRTFACYLLSSFLERATRVSDEAQLVRILALISPLLGAGSGFDSDTLDALEAHTQEDSEAAASKAKGLDKKKAQAQAEEEDEEQGELDWDEFAEEQCLLGRFLWLCKADQLESQFRMIRAIKKAIWNGGPMRWKYTLPPLIFHIYQLALNFYNSRNLDSNWITQCTKLLHLAHTILSQVHKRAQQNAESVAANEAECVRFISELTLRLYLQGLLVMNELNAGGFDNEETIIYEFFTQVMSIYEEEISDSKQKLQALQVIIGTLEQLKCFGIENADTLRSQVALAASKLLKKPDQSRAVAMCANLFWSGKNKDNREQEIHDEKRVLECLKKSTKIAQQCSMEKTGQVLLYIEIFRRYIYFRAKGNSLITSELIQQFSDKIAENLNALVSESKDSAPGDSGGCTGEEPSAGDLAYVRRQFETSQLAWRNASH